MFSIALLLQNATTLSDTWSEFGAVFALRLVLVFLGAGILGVFLHRAASSPGKENLMANVAYAAFVLVLVGEVLGRFLFYATAGTFGLQ